MSLEPTDISVPHRKPEDTAAGCRILASDDRERAAQSDSEAMRMRLVGSSDTWAARADLLDRIEGNRARMIEAKLPQASAAGENDNG